MIRIYNQNETSFISNGIGILKDAIVCKATEQLNGQYELQLDYPTQGWLASEIVEGNIIKAPVGHVNNEEQLFRIKIVKRTLTRISILAPHISYDLNDNILEDVAPTDKVGATALAWMFERTQYPHNFQTLSDIPTVATARYVKKNLIEALLGADNSFVKVWGGELLRNNFLINFKQARGQDRGVKIRYGKNLTEIQWDIDQTEIATRIYPQGSNGISIPEGYIDSPIIANYPHPIIKSKEFNDIKIDETNGITEAIAQQQLRDAVIKLYENGIDKPKVNIKVNFIELSKTVEYYTQYSAFESIFLGDTVQAIIMHLGLTLSLKIIKTVYDVLLQKYESFEIGDVKADYVSSNINKIESLVKMFSNVNPSNILQQAKDNATQQIISALGGNVYKTASSLYIMDTDNLATAQKVWCWNINGLGYSSTGIGGPYNIAMTADGQIVADRITTGQMSIARIVGLTDTLSGLQSSIELNNDNINFNITNAVGNNLLPNSTLKLGLDKNVTVSGTVTFEDFMDVVKNTISKTSYKINAGYVKYNRVFCEPGIYTLSPKILRIANTHPYIEIYAGINQLLEVNVKEDNFEEMIVSIDNMVGYIDVKIGCNENYCLVSDVMLNSGANKLTFSLYPGEFVSTNFQFSDNGLEISSSIKKTKLVANAEELAIFNTENNEKQVTFNKDNTDMTRATIENRLNVGKLRHTVLDNGDVMVTMDD